MLRAVGCWHCKLGGGHIRCYHFKMISERLIGSFSMLTSQILENVTREYQGKNREHCSKADISICKSSR